MMNNNEPSNNEAGQNNSKDTRMPEKETILIPVGNNKALVYEADPAKENEKVFAEQCKEVAAPRPQSVQDFFVRLAALQKKQRRQIPGKGKGMGL